MKRIQEVKTRREKAFYKARCVQVLGSRWVDNVVERWRGGRRREEGRRGGRRRREGHRREGRAGRDDGLAVNGRCSVAVALSFLVGLSSGFSRLKRSSTVDRCSSFAERWTRFAEPERSKNTAGGVAESGALDYSPVSSLPSRMTQRCSGSGEVVRLTPRTFRRCLKARRLLVPVPILTLRHASYQPPDQSSLLPLTSASLTSHSMAAAAPKVLASDSLEVTRSSHLLSLQNPTPHTKKALTASSILLAARAEKKLARQQRGGKRAVEFDGEGLGSDEEGMESDSGDSELDVADALREADMGEMDVEDEVKEKVKSKVKVGKQKSSLRKTGGGGMGMGMQVDA